MGKPKIRFQGYTEDWEQRKLGDVADVTKLAGFEFTEHVVYSDEGNIIALRGLNIKNGQLILDDVKYIDGSNFSKLSRSKLYVNDIMFTYVGTVGEVAIIKENDRFYLAPNVSRIRIESDDLPEYISQYMRTEQFYRTVLFPLIATSSQPALSMENIRKFVIYLPMDKEEQKAIADALNFLDHLITLHQRKCDETKKLKKYMLQKMFPQNGHSVPEIRFSGFTEDWEQRKFGDDNDLITGYPFESEKFSEEGIKLVRGMNVKRGYLDFSNDICVRWNSTDGLENYLLEADDILIQMDGALIGKSYAKIAEEQLPALLVQRVTRARTRSKDACTDFMYQTIQRDFWRYIGMNKTETAVPHLSLNDIYNFKIMVPCLGEQQQIGAYFTNLDHLITLHQQKCEKLQKIKKFMLQNMFV